MELAQIIEQRSEVARKKLIQKSEQDNSEDSSVFQGLLFVGNRHETVPFRLLTDKYLTPRAKTAWQMIKLNAQQFQGAAFPSYEELGYWLSDRGFQGKRLSRKTISQTLLLLRLTRWLTLSETVRNARGQILGNVYVMNDEPLGITDCLQLNEDYLRLLEKSAKHADPLIKDVAEEIIHEILEQKQLWHFVSHIDVIRSRYHQLKTGFAITQENPTLPENISEAVQLTQQKLLSSNMELSNKSRELSEKSTKSPSSNMELSPQNDTKSLILGLVPKRNLDNTQYSTSTKNNKYSTCTHSEKLFVHLEQLKLNRLENEMVSRELLALDDQTQDAVLFEAQQRIAAGNIKKPMGYLISLIRRAKTGDFKPYLINKSSQSASSSASVNAHSSRRILHTPKVVHQESNLNPMDLINKLTQSLNRK